MSEAGKPLTADRERLPNRRAHTLLNIEASGFRYVAGVGHHDDGRLAEIFLNAEKGGTAISDAARDSAVVASLAPYSTALIPTRCGTLSCVTAAGSPAARWACRSIRSATALIARRGSR
jgi:hypothetical protein